MMPRHIAIICNPLSGKGKPLRLLPLFERFLRSKQLCYSTFTGNLPPSTDGFSDLVIMGGDGTLNHVLNHFGRIPVPVGYIPCGTGNDTGNLLLPGQTLEQLMETAITGQPKPIDCGRCNDRLFINGAGIGFDGRVARRLLAKSLFTGKAAYYGTVLLQLVRYRERWVTVTAGEHSWKTPLFMLNAANGRTYGGGFRVAPLADMQDGLLELITIGKISLWQRLRYLPVMEKGNHLSLPFIDYRQPTRVSIVSDHLLDAHLDGEYLQSHRFDIQVLPAWLNMRCTK